MIAVLLVAAACSSVAAQTFHGTIRGSVRDANGVIGGAAVRLTEETTGFLTTTLTNDSGEYAFEDLLPGTYRMRAAAVGYKRLATRRTSNCRFALPLERR
jgi:hypothetical protein